MTARSSGKAAGIPYDVRGVKSPHVPDVRWPEEGSTLKAGKSPLRSRKALEKLVDAVAPYRMYSPEMLADLPPTRWLIKGLLGDEELMGLYGKGDTYKSFIAIGWGCSLAAAGRPVLYLAAEGSTGIRTRIEAWKQHQGVPALPNMLVLPVNVDLHKRAAVEDCIHKVRTQFREGQHPALVVVDTLARNFVGGSENSAQDMGLFVDGCELLRRELRTAVLVIHHTDKADQYERGTESLRNASFAMFKTDDARRGERTHSVRLTCDRMKEADRPNDKRLYFDRVELPDLTPNGEETLSSLVLTDSGRPETETGPEKRPKVSGPSRRVLKKLSDPKYDPNGASPAELRRAVPINGTLLKRQAKLLSKSGYLRITGKTRSTRYHLTDEGRKCLG